MGRSEDDQTGRLTSWLGGAAVIPALTVALAAVALSSLGYAWLHREVWQPFLANRDAIDGTLRRTTIVVASMVVLLACYVVSVWLTRKSPSDTVRRRDDVLRYLVPTLLLAAVLGGVARHTGATADTFRAAAAQEAGLGPARVAGFASLTWWCAILAVATLALLCVQGVPAPRARVGRTWWRGALLTGFAVLFSSALLQAAMLRPVHVPASRTAAPSDPPPTPELTGKVAFALDVPKYGRYPLLPGGPGFIREVGDVVEAGDGVTGQVRWSFARPGLAPTPVIMAGEGRDGVLVLEASYADHPLLLGVDGMTGTPLWTRPGAVSLTSGPGSKPQASGQALLVYEDAPQGSLVSALSPRTGRTMWQATLTTDCETRLRLTKSTVVLGRCDTDDPDLVVTVRDARTGDVTRELRTSAFDVDPIGLEPGYFVETDPDTDLAVVSFRDPEGSATSRARLLDVATGRLIRELPDDTIVSFLGATSLFIGGGTSPSILDLTTGSEVATDIASQSSKYVDGPGTGLAQLGEHWVTFVPAGTNDRRDVLKIFSADAPVRVLPAPCPMTDGVPTVAPMPGALMVNCGAKVVGLR